MAKRDELEIVVHKRNVDGALEHLNGVSVIPAQTKTDINAFVSWGYREKLSDARVLKYVQILTKLGTILKKDYRASNRQDLEKVVDWINSAGLSDWTQQSYSVALKKFMWWVRNQEIQEKNDEITRYNRENPDSPKPYLEELCKGEYPREAKWIKTSKKGNTGYFGIELPKELLNEEDAIMLIEAAYNYRDKAAIAVLYECGMRVGELLSMRIRDVEFPDDPGGLGNATLTGKTGQRQVFFNWSKPYLREWIFRHPDSKNPAAPLWSGLHQADHLSYRYLCAVIEKAAKKSGMSKPHHPHQFRHSAATRNARFMSYSQLCDYFGWAPNSKMPAIYIHKNGLQTKEAMERAHGITEKKESLEESRLKPKICSNCSKENAAESKYCNGCGAPLTMQAAMGKELAVKSLGELQLELMKGDITGDEWGRRTSGIIDRLVEKK
jgi:site-specific recombinase XerD